MTYHFMMFQTEKQLLMSCYNPVRLLDKAIEYLDELEQDANSKFIQNYFLFDLLAISITRAQTLASSIFTVAERKETKRNERSHNSSRHRKP